MESIRKSWNRFKKSVKEFHTKKPHIEFFTALLTIPVLLTVIILNINNLKSNESKNKEQSTKTETIVITQGDNSNKEQKEVVITKEACKAGIGDIEIVSPEEDENIKDNPVNIDINYDQGDFCEVVWSYRVNGGNWSSYDNRSIALYNLTPGNVKFDLRVKSVVNSSQKNLSRSFIYSGLSDSPTTSPTPSLTPVQ